jgi:hypothetical protein
LKLYFVAVISSYGFILPSQSAGLWNETSCLMGTPVGIQADMQGQTRSAAAFEGVTKG